MNVAIFSPSKNPYSETFIQAHKHGLKGTVYYYYGTNHILLEGQAQKITTLNRVLLKIKSKILNKPSTYVRDQILLKSLKLNKIEAILVEYGNHAHYLKDLLKISRLPVIVHFHGYDASKEAVIKGCNNYKEVFLLSKYVIAVSKTMQAKLISLGCSEEKVIYNPYGPNPDFLTLEPQFSEDIFIGLGRFVDKKAPYYVLLAFKNVLDKFPNAQLVIGGKGELYETCKNLVSYFKIADNVLLPGVLSRSEFLEYLKKGLAFVQHSITALNGDQEGTPVAILEASAAGLPVLATKHAGIQDVIQDGRTGFLVSEHDVASMTDKMILLLENKDLAMEMGKKGKERIHSEFTLEKHLQTLDTLLEKVIL